MGEAPIPPYVSEDYCMCGLGMDEHTASENHAPLSEADYYRERFLDAVRRIPPTWACCRCGREFDNTPFAGRPAAFEVVTDEATGLQREGGKICTTCFYRPTPETGRE